MGTLESLLLQQVLGPKQHQPLIPWNTQKHCGLKDQLEYRGTSHTASGK